MLICYNKLSHRLVSLIQGYNPMPLFDENIEYVDVEDNTHFVFRRGDLVTLEYDKELVRIGGCELRLKHKGCNLYTVVNEENCNGPIFLEEI